MFLIAEEKDLKIKEIAEHTGHAIEMRLYAENPQVKFLPSPGKLEKFHLPESENVRVDTGFPEGYTVTPLFDPMLAKIIFYGETRDLAIENGKNFQNKVDILGIKNNLSLIEKVLNHEEFVSGQYKTGFLESL